MRKAPGFLRRRKPQTIQEEPEASGFDDCVERSADSEARPRREASTRRRSLSFSNAPRQHRTTAKDPSRRASGRGTDLRESGEAKADALARSMARRWFGVEEPHEEDNLMPSMSNGTRYVQSWLARSSHLPQEGGADLDSTHEATALHQRQLSSESVLSNYGSLVAKNHGRRYAMLFCLLPALLGSVLMLFSVFYGLLSFHDGTHLVGCCSSELPMGREGFYKVLLFEENPQRDYRTFERGLREAARTLRVNVSLEYATNISSAIENIERASNALFDGLAISSASNDNYLKAVMRANQENTVMLLGSLESFACSRPDGALLHIGDPESVVGNMAGQKMQEAGVKAVLCISHAGNADSMHRCRGLREAFGPHTYDLELKTKMQSELKSKLIPIILDEGEINGLFVADTQSFHLVHQILKSLKRLCTSARLSDQRDCVYVGAYGATKQILQKMTALELQFTIDPQEYLRGYLVTTLLRLRSLGYKMGFGPDQSTSFVTSQVVDSFKEASGMLKGSTCAEGDRRNSPQMNFEFFLFKSWPRSWVDAFKDGLRRAARDLKVQVHFHNVPTEREVLQQESLFNPKDAVGTGVSKWDSQCAPCQSILNSICELGKPVLTFGEYDTSRRVPCSTLHVGYSQEDLLRERFSPLSRFFEACPTRSSEEGMELVLDTSPVLQGYMSLLFLVIDTQCQQQPDGMFNTAVYT